MQIAALFSNKKNGDGYKYQGRIQEFWLGGAWIFFQRHGVRGNALVGSQGAKPPEPPEF